MVTLAEALARAAAFHEAGDLPGVERLCRQVLQAEPTQPDALHRLGLVALQTGRTDLALDCLTRALARRPNYPAFLVNLGLLYQQLDGRTEAEASFRRALQLRPDYADAHFHLGHALLAWGERGEAVPCFQA